MYTILMDKYKNLNTTVRTTLFQQESMVDKIQFLIPPTYQDIELKDYVVTLKYVDPNGNFHSEVLELDADLYKDYLRYALPVTTKLTQVVGNISLRLTFIKFSDEDGVTEIDKLESNSTTLMIQKPDGFNDYVNFEDIEAYKAKISQLNKDVEDMYEKIPTDLEIGDGENLHLVHDETKIGEGVEILQPAQFDDLDDENDGIVDVDNLKDDPSPTPQNQFIEL